MNKDKYRFRYKEGKIQVQKLIGDKWKSRTLSDPQAIYEMLCPEEIDINMSSNTQENKENETQKVV